MPIRFDETTSWLEEVCAVEEAEPLLAWLQGGPDRRVDLGRCSHLHTAVLQVLLAARPVLAAPPEDGFLARHVAPLLAGGAPDRAGAIPQGGPAA